LFGTKVFHAHGKETFQPGRAAVSCFNPKQSFVTSFVSAPKTNVSESTVFSQTNKLVEKRFVFEGLKLAPTEFVLSFQFQSNFSEKGLLRAPKLTFPHGKGWFWEENICFLFRSFQAKAWAAKKTLFSACKTNLSVVYKRLFQPGKLPFLLSKALFPSQNTLLVASLLEKGHADGRPWLGHVSDSANRGFGREGEGPCYVGGNMEHAYARW
jgi:hypothetical protein